MAGKRSRADRHVWKSALPGYPRKPAPTTNPLSSAQPSLPPRDAPLPQLSPGIRSAPRRRAMGGAFSWGHYGLLSRVLLDSMHRSGLAEQSVTDGLLGPYRLLAESQHPTGLSYPPALAQQHFRLFELADDLFCAVTLSRHRAAFADPIVLSGSVFGSRSVFSLEISFRTIRDYSLATNTCFHCARKLWPISWPCRKTASNPSSVHAV